MASNVEESTNRSCKNIADDSSPLLDMDFIMKDTSTSISNNDLNPLMSVDLNMKDLLHSCELYPSLTPALFNLLKRQREKSNGQTEKMEKTSHKEKQDNSSTDCLTDVQLRSVAKMIEPDLFDKFGIALSIPQEELEHIKRNHTISIEQNFQLLKKWQNTTLPSSQEIELVEALKKINIINFLDTLLEDKQKIFSNPETVCHEPYTYNGYTDELICFILGLHFEAKFALNDICYAHVEEKLKSLDLVEMIRKDELLKTQDKFLMSEDYNERLEANLSDVSEEAPSQQSPVYSDDDYYTSDTESDIQEDVIDCQLEGENTTELNEEEQKAKIKDSKTQDCLLSSPSSGSHDTDYSSSEEAQEEKNLTKTI